MGEDEATTVASTKKKASQSTAPQIEENKATYTSESIISKPKIYKAERTDF